MFRPLKIALCAAALSSTALLATPDASAQPQEKHSKHFEVVMHSRGQLGAKVIHISDDLRRYFGAPTDSGLLVDKVLPDTPAAKAGLKSGDLILTVDGKKIADTMDIFKALSKFKKDDTVNVGILRNKKKQTLKATLDGKGRSMKWKSGDTPFDFDFNFGDEFDMDFGKSFPFNHGPLHMQEQMRKLEERLNRLEGKKSKKKGKTAPKGEKKFKAPKSSSGPKS
jgi:hypothetical protein